jgi:hypothetical protein
MRLPDFSVLLLDRPRLERRDPLTLRLNDLRQRLDLGVLPLKGFTKDRPQLR